MAGKLKRGDETEIGSGKKQLLTKQGERALLGLQEFTCSLALPSVQARVPNVGNEDSPGSWIPASLRPGAL